MEHIGQDWERLFGERVRDLRVANEWTQHDLARAMGDRGYSIHQTTVAKIEGGNRPTPVGEVATLAAIFQVPITHFFTSDDARTAHLELLELAHLRAELDRLAETAADIDIQRQLNERNRRRVQRNYDALERRLRASDRLPATPQQPRVED